MSAGAIGRRAVKAAALPFGLPAGRRTGDLVILLYHRVGSGDREIDLTRAAFERQLDWLAEHAPPAPFDEALGGRAGGVVVTFDDGSPDFAEHVLPLLAQYRVPATLYLATGMVTGPGDGLSWPQLEEAVASGYVTMGSHTHDHTDLSHVSSAVAEEEMRRSKDLIESKLGVACRHFAYPWAVSSEAADGVARRLFASAAVGWGTNRAARIDPHRLGRTPVLRSDGSFFFRMKVEGRLDGEALAYRLLRRGPWRRS
jgi:peptidoglycan/xylan/chitin deacetylase (PgdA/CDA1 family)